MFGLPLEFVIFGIVLVAISLYQRYALAIAAAGLAALVLFRLIAGFTLSSVAPRQFILA